MRDMSNYSKEHWDEDTRRFAEDWSEFLCKAIIKMIDGVYDKDVENFKEEYGEVFDKIKRLVTGNLEDEEIRLFIDELGRGFYNDIINLVKKRAASRERLPGTPYKKGDFIGQKYEIHDVLGMGGFGIVYLVYSRETESVYALKTFRDEYLEDSQTRDRFKKEAQIWIDLERHPYLVRAYLVDEISDRLFIATEYIASDEDGLNSLDVYLKRRPPDIPQSLKWGIQFCHGMEYAYSKGIRAHRDIKPANILIGQDRSVKISDFGLAGVIGQARISGIKLDIQNNKVGFSCQTMEGSGFGTPTHMPPEQFTNAAACDERSDIYSFGIVLFQMATGGKLPFLANLPRNEAEHKQFWHDMHKLHSQAPVPRLDSPLFPIILKCLEKEANRRYPSFKDLRADLEPILKRLTGEVVKLPEQKELDGREWNNKGFSLSALGMYQEAITYYDKALEINQRDAMLWYNKGAALYWLGKYKEMLDCCNKSLELDNQDLIAWYNKGLALHNLGRYQEAIPCYDRALEIGNVAWAGNRIWQNKSYTLYCMSKYQEAIACFDNALEIDPNDTYSLKTKGLALEKLGRHQEAIACYEKALEINPNDAIAWYNKGLALQKLGNLQAAIDAFEYYIKLTPLHEKDKIAKAKALIREVEAESSRSGKKMSFWKRLFE